jgi:predicted nuclease with TOPRIM domain
LSTIVVERQEWEQLMQDTDRLTKNFEKLLDKIKGLEADKQLLEEKLTASQARQQELQQKSESMKKGEIDQKEMSTLRELHSTVARMLKESEEMKIV